MNRSDINKYLTDPNLVEHTTSDDLRRLIDIYPYCEALYWIYLRSLYIKDDAIFDDELMKYGLHISNRKLFYNYLTYELTTNSTPNQDSQLPIINPQLSTPDYFALEQNQAQKQSLQQLAEQLKKARLTRQQQNTENKNTTHLTLNKTTNPDNNPQPKPNTSNLPPNPTHTTPKANKTPKIEKDKQTLDSDLSEEKAKKLIKEQKYLEAIEILRAISLNNPKKSANFALQIKFLETIINNHNKK